MHFVWNVVRQALPCMMPLMHLTQAWLAIFVMSAQKSGAAPFIPQAA